MRNLTLTATVTGALATAALFAQNPNNPNSVDAVSAWLGFFQDHRAALDQAASSAKTSATVLAFERDRAGRRFALSAYVHTQVINVTTSFAQKHAPLAADNRAKVDAARNGRPAETRQDYLNRLAQRDKNILDAVADLRRTMSPRDFKALQDRVYARYGPRPTPTKK